MRSISGVLSADPCLTCSPCQRRGARCRRHGSGRPFSCLHSPTADEKEPKWTGTFSGAMPTYNVPENTRSARVRELRSQPTPRRVPIVARPRVMALPGGVQNVECCSPVHSVQRSHSLGLEAPYAWTGTSEKVYGALAMARCLCALRPGCLARPWCNAAIAVIERGPRALRGASRSRNATHCLSRCAPEV